MISFFRSRGDGCAPQSPMVNSSSRKSGPQAGGATTFIEAFQGGSLGMGRGDDRLPVCGVYAESHPMEHEASAFLV